jgi:hypothetical protein
VIEDENWVDHDILKLMDMLEGMVRVSSNLHEELHHSIWFYMLLGSRLFVGLPEYAPVLLLALVPLMIMMFQLSSILLNSRDENADSDDDKIKTNNRNENYKNDENKSETENEKDRNENDNNDRIIDENIVNNNGIKNEIKFENIAKEKNEKMKKKINNSLLSGLFSFFIDNIMVFYFLFIQLTYYNKNLPHNWMDIMINLNYNSYITTMTIKIIYTYFNKNSKNIINNSNSSNKDNNISDGNSTISNENNTISNENKNNLTAYCLIVTLTLFLSLAYIGITCVYIYVYIYTCTCVYVHTCM